MGAAKKVFQSLSEQYLPLEKYLLAKLKSEGSTEVIKEYKKLSYERKIFVLDGVASKLGL